MAAFLSDLSILSMYYTRLIQEWEDFCSLYIMYVLCDKRKLIPELPASSRVITEDDRIGRARVTLAPLLRIVALLLISLKGFCPLVHLRSTRMIDLMAHSCEASGGVIVKGRCGVPFPRPRKLMRRG